MHCAEAATPGTVEYMTQRWSASGMARVGMLGGLMALASSMACAEQPSQVATAGFSTYIGALEARLAAQHRQSAGFVFLADPTERTEARLRRGDLVVENLTPAKTNLPGAMLYHWRGTAFL